MLFANVWMNWSASFTLKPKPIEIKLYRYIFTAPIRLQMYVHSVFANFGEISVILYQKLIQHNTSLFKALHIKIEVRWYIFFAATDIQFPVPFVPRLVPFLHFLYFHSSSPPAQTLEDLSKWSTVTKVKFEFENDFQLAPPKNQLPWSNAITYLMTH